MCMVSAIYDHFKPLIPNIEPTTVQPLPRKFVSVPWTPPIPMDELRALIAEFREMVAAARRVDKLTNQPDCEDPAKAKLEERVAALEAKIAKLQAAFGE